MGHYRFYEIDPHDNITVGYSVECRSDTDAKRAAAVEVWQSNNRVAHLSVEARHLWGQLRDDWIAPAADDVSAIAGGRGEHGEERSGGRGRHRLFCRWCWA